METEVAAEVVNQLSMWDMVWSSDLITKAVMIGLIAASVWSWAIILKNKYAAPSQTPVQDV